VHLVYNVLSTFLYNIIRLTTSHTHVCLLTHCVCVIAAISVCVCVFVCVCDSKCLSVCGRLRGPEKIALKIIKNIDKYREAAKLEINVLDRLNRLDPHNTKYVYCVSFPHSLFFPSNISYFHLQTTPCTCHSNGTNRNLQLLIQTLFCCHCLCVSASVCVYTVST